MVLDTFLIELVVTGIAGWPIMMMADAARPTADEPVHLRWMLLLQLLRGSGFQVVARVTVAPSRIDDEMRLADVRPVPVR